jgi:hypothetical protein
MTSTPNTPFVAPPTEDGELVDDGADGAEETAPLDSADADRAASYGEDVSAADQDAEAAEDGVDADRRAAMPQTD